MSRRTEPMETYPSNTKTNPIPPLRPTQGRGAANPTASVPQGQTGRTAAQRNTGVPQRGQNARQSYKPPTRGRPVQNTGSQPWLRNYGRRGQSSGASGGTGSRGTTGTTGGNPFRNANTGAANLADMNEIMGVSSYTGDPEDVAQDFLRQNGVSSPEEYQKKFFAEQAEKRQQREARRKAQEERARQYSELYGDEEAAAEYMGLRGGYTGEVDDLVQAEWERNGVSDAAGYRKVAEYQWRNMAGGTVDTLRNSANDLSYRLQEGRAEQLAENDAVRDAANGKGNYEDLYRYYLAKYQEETKDFEPVKAVDWGEAYNAETARMADEEGFNDYVRRDGQLYRAVGAMVPALTVSAGANIAGAAFAAGGAYGSARAAAEVGKALSASLTFSSASGSAYEEAIANGMDPEKAMQLATAAGAIELGTEALSSGFGSFAGRKLGIGGAADGFLEGIVGKLTDDPYVRGALVSMSGMLGEGFEEFLSEWGGYAAQKLLGGYDTRTMGEVWKDSLESFRDGAFVAGLLNAATLLQCGVPPQTAIEVGIDEAMTQDNVSLREDIDGRKTASTVNTTETANRVSESLRQKLPQRDLERFSETFELSPAGEKLAEALAGMDAVDAARLTEAVTDAVADADDSGSKKEKIRDSRVAALKDMAKETLADRFRKDGELRDTADRARQIRQERSGQNSSVEEIIRRIERGESYDYLEGIPAERRGNSVIIPEDYGIVYSDGNRYPVVVAPYVEAPSINRRMGLPNTQAHHVVQNAIYGEIVAKRDGMTISVEGNVFRDSGSLHNRMHALSDAELDTFRASGTIPTNAEYAAISARGLQSVGFHEAVIEYVMDQVIRQQRKRGLQPDMPIPRMPRKMYFGQEKTTTKKELHDESIL